VTEEIHVDIVVLGQVFLSVLWISPVIVIMPLFIFTRVTSGRWTVGTLVAAFP
jgi:hypothetical protein